MMHGTRLPDSDTSRPVPEPSNQTFKSPKRLLGDVDAKSALAAIMAAADIALVIDSNGKIKDIAFSDESFAHEGVSEWVGRRWRDTVAKESHPKIEALLKTAGESEVSRARHVNHATPNGNEVPIQYVTLRFGSKGNIVAVGRDLRALAAMQQQVIEAQQAIARDYARMRQLETRYRLLFRTANEAVIIVEPTTGKVIDANPAFSQLLGKPVGRLAGKRLSSWFSREETRVLMELMSEILQSGETRRHTSRLTRSKTDVEITASRLETDEGAQVMLALVPGNSEESTASQSRAHLLSLFDQLPDGFVVTDTSGRIVTANPAFLELAQLDREEEARGQHLENYIGRSGVEFSVLLNNLKEQGTVRHFATVLNGELGSSEAVDISCVLLEQAQNRLFGFTVRPVGGRPVTANASRMPLPRSLDSMTDLIGRVPMKDLVREAKDMIERLCIEAALDLTDDNKASAAEVLGLSRQGLYAKMRQYDIGDLDAG
ncbi:MAG: transcriptional regulator PpsR [Pseudomonadota bacterium]